MRSSAVTRYGMGLVVLLTGWVAAAPGTREGPDPLRACRDLLAVQPRSAEGYQCLFARSAGHRAAVGRILADRLRVRPDDPRALLYEGLFHSFAAENVSESQYSRAVQGFRREHDDPGQVVALVSQLGQRCFSEDTCDPRALALVEEAERIAERGDDVHSRRLAQVWWLRWAVKQDDLALAERAIERLDALPAQDPPWMATQLTTQRAFLASVLGNLEEALDRYSQLLAASTPGSAQYATALGGQAAAAASLAQRGKYDPAEAEQLLRTAIVEQDRLGIRVSISDPGVGSLATRAHLALLLGPTEESLRLLDEAQAAYRSAPGWSYPWYADWLKARFLAEQPAPRFDQALSAAEAGVARAAGPSSAWEHGRSVLMRGWVHWKAGRDALGRQDGLAALDALEDLRRRQGDARVRMRYEDTLAFAYELVAGSLLGPRRTPPTEAQIDEALGTMERLRARGLLESLVGGPSAPGRLSQSIEETHRRLLEGVPSGSQREALVGRLRTAEREIAAQRTRAGEQTPPPLRVPTVEELQGALAPSEALISFQQWTAEPDVLAPYGEVPSWAIVLTRDRRQAVPVPGALAVEAPARLWLALLDRRDGSDAAGGAALYRQLLAPVVAAIPAGVTALVIVPDGVLHRLPLEALRLSPSGPFLAERFEVSVVPSAAVWYRLRSAPARAGGRALAVADPVLSPRARRELERLSIAGSDLELPRSREEAMRALRAFPTGSRLLLGAEATEEAFKHADLGSDSALHLASHALLDLARPERSALVLGASATEDGLLTVEEIARLKLDRALVVLGACHTSGGALRRGEGTLSLARAFFEAGARSAIGNLTVVRDDESAALFSAFYRHIEQGEPVGRALTLAKRERIAAGAPPASWASYVLLGDSSTTPRMAGARWSRWISAGALGMGLVLLSVLLARRRAGRPRGRLP